jgi:hypothetical protein
MWVLKLSDMKFISRVYSIQEPNEAFNHLKFNITLVSKYICSFLYHKKQKNILGKITRKLQIFVILRTFFIFDIPENELCT